MNKTSTLAPAIDWDSNYAAVWRPISNSLRMVANPDLVNLDQLIGIDEQREQLIHNTQRFIAGQPANSALLWGARGTGKSSLVKAVLDKFKDQGLRLVEVYKNDLQSLPEIVDQIRDLPYRFIIYCDDFSFEENENSYVVLKSILDGSIEARPENTLMYVTSNRRHLLPEYMQDNLGTKLVDGEIHYTDAVEEKQSLADRFGLWISFYPIAEAMYLDIVDSYFTNFSGSKELLHQEAIAFARQRASRSGRTALQFYNYYFNSSAEEH